MRSSDDAGLDELAAWYWVRPGVQEVRTSRVHLVVHNGTTSVVDANPADSNGGAAPLLDEIRGLARRYGAGRPTQGAALLTQRVSFG